MEIPKIIAYKIDLKYVYIRCVFCQKVHRHGSNKDFKNRTEHRSAHCDEGKSYDIIIDDSTTAKDTISHYEKYKDSYIKIPKETIRGYTKKRYLKYNEDKMFDRIKNTIDEYPVMLQRLTKHYMLKAIEDN